jgi:TIR domain-containing protein/conflict system STAND superfamily ATPase
VVLTFGPSARTLGNRDRVVLRRLVGLRTARAAGHLGAAPHEAVRTVGGRLPRPARSEPEVLTGTLRVATVVLHGRGWGREVAVARVFVSHAGEDAALACEMHRWLVADGHEVFLDRDLRDGIVVGEEWQARLHERLRWADALLCVLTSAYISSTWCIAEVGIAQSRGSRLLPVRAEPGVTHPLLKAVQHIDLAPDGMVARAKLAEALRRVDTSGGSGWPDDRSPFPGLRPFDTDLHRVFFGRAGEVEQLAALLRSPAEHAAHAVLLVVGPSGCGKSSLIRAGCSR